jgi:phage terminase large subunit-like protein
MAKQPTLAEMLGRVAEGVRKQATHPDMSGYKPHRKQLVFHRSNDHLRLYFGGNRAGKTHGGVIEDLWWALGEHPYIETPEPPIRGRVIVTDFKLGLGEVMLPKFKALCRPSDLKGGSWDTAYNREDRKITFKNDSEIQFLSYEQDLNKFAGSSQHFIHFDEEPPKDIYNESHARVIDTDGKMWMTMTPVDGITWVYDDLYEPVKESADRDDIVLQEDHVGPCYRSETYETTVVEVATEENPHVGEKARERFFKTLSVEERAARSQGQFVAAGGKVFPHFSKETHVIPMPKNLREYFQGWEIYSSVDHGWRNPTAWLWHAVHHTGTIITFYEHYRSELTIPIHSKTVLEIEQAIGLPSELRVGDPAMNQKSALTGTSAIQEYASNGIYISTEGIPRDQTIGTLKLQQYFELRGRVLDAHGRVLDKGRPTWLITENCVNTIKELRNLTYEKFDSAKVRYKNNKRETVQKKNDHAFDSMKYFATLRPDLAPERPELSMDEILKGELFARGTKLGYSGTVLPYDQALADDVRRRKEADDSSWDIVERFT